VTLEDIVEKPENELEDEVKGLTITFLVTDL